MTQAIQSFSGPYRFLSNFWMVPIVFQEMEYPSVEHAFVAAKSISPAFRQQIQRTHSPGMAKRKGRKVKLRKNWDSMRLDIMETLVRQKFDKKLHPKFHKKLMDTGDAELIEGNHWGDTFWGVCNGVGENHLGKILMKVRDDAKS